MLNNFLFKICPSSKKFRKVCKNIFFRNRFVWGLFRAEITQKKRKIQRTTEKWRSVCLFFFFKKKWRRKIKKKKKGDRNNFNFAQENIFFNKKEIFTNIHFQRKTQEGDHKTTFWKAGEGYFSKQEEITTKGALYKAWLFFFSKKMWKRMFFKVFFFWKKKRKRGFLRSSRN